MAIGRTEIAGLIGPNGAGKTTVFNLLTKVYQPSRGTIMLDGVDTAHMNTIQVNKAGIARTFQNIRLFDKLTVEDNVKLAFTTTPAMACGRGVFRLPKYWSQEKRAHQRALDLLSILTCRTWQAPRPVPSLWRPAPAGDRPGSGHGTQAAAAGRTCRRHEPPRRRRS